MTAWKWICLAEAIAILLAWLLLGGSAPSEISAEDSSTKLAQPTTASAPALTVTERGGAIEPDRADRADVQAPLPRPWSDAPDTLTLLISVVDEEGEPVRNGSGAYQQDGDAQAQSLNIRDDYRVILTDLRAGGIQIDLRCTGFLPYSQIFQLSSEPSVQRLTLHPQRARRVLLYLHASSGELLGDWLQRELGWSPSEQLISAQLSQEPAGRDRPAKGARPRGNEWGDFVDAAWATGKLPQGCTGAFDIRTEVPLHAAIWLGRLYLGSIPIALDAREVRLRVDEAALLPRFSSLRLRVVDAATGTALPNAIVRLSFPWGGGNTQRTDENGVVEFLRVVSENRNLSIDLLGYAGTYRELQLDSGVLLDLGDISLSRSGKIRARLLAPDGTPLGREIYRIFPTGSWTRPEEPQPMSTRTDAEGWIEFQTGTERHQALFGGRSHALQAAIWERGSAEAGEREIRLQPGVEVRLSTLAPEGQERLIWLLDAEGRLLAPSRPSSVQPISFLLAPGTYLLRVEDLDRNLLGTLDLRVPDGGGDLEVALP